MQAQTLNKRILSVILSTAALAFIVVSFGAGIYQYNALQKRYAASMQGQAAIANSLIQGQLLQNDQRYVQIIAQSAKLDRQSTVLEYVANRLHLYDPYDLFYIIDQSGKILRLSQPYNKSYLQLNLSHMNHITDNLKISGVYQSIFSQRSVIALSYPLENNMRLIIERDLENILPALDHLEKGWILPQQSIFIVDAEGRAMYHTNQELVRTRQNLLFDLKDFIQASGHGLSSYTYIGKSYLAYNETLKVPANWHLFIQVPAASLQQSIIKSIGMLLFVLFILISVIVMLLRALLNRLFSTPISNITKDLSNWHPGQQNGPVVSPDNDQKVEEFSQIINAINRMAGDIIQSNRIISESEARYRSLINTTDTGYVIVDKRGIVLDANREYIRLSGHLHLDEILGRCVIEWTAEHDHKRNATEIEKCFKKGVIRNLEIDYIDRDGNITPVEINGTVVEEKGQPIILTMARDLTERKTAEQNLAKEKEQLTVTLRSIGDGVICTDTAGNVTLLNKISEELTGWSHKEAVGKPLGEVFHIISEKTREISQSPVQEVLASGKIVGLANHTTLIAKDGKEYSIADSGAPIRDQQSQIIGVVLVFRDVTEQNRTEAELIKVRKLESIGVLAGGIAHDFNNILAAILGNINLALFDTDLKDRTKQLLSAAEKASLRAKDLTQQLLTFAKGGEPVKEVSSIHDVIKDSANFVLHGDKVACRFTMPENLRLVEIDKGQISQVIQNIVLNASHAMPEGGVVTVNCENVLPNDLPSAPQLSKENCVKITIKDDGIGMPANVMGKIFDPYFSTKQEGSGLGLAITYSIIAKHNGHIAVESTPGIGTTFTIFLPAADQGKAEAPQLELQHKTLTQAKILIMDDEEMVLDIASEMLSQLGHQVERSKNGAEAIALYREAQVKGSKFDLVIMDLTVPGGMGGEEAVKKIISLDPDARVIVSSGYSNDPIMGNFKKYGFCSTIVKPYRLQELSDIISEIILV